MHKSRMFTDSFDVGLLKNIFYPRKSQVQDVIKRNICLHSILTHKGNKYYVYYNVIPVPSQSRNGWMKSNDMQFQKLSNLCALPLHRLEMISCAV